MLLQRSPSTGQYLVAECGASIDAANGKGQTALMVAASDGHLDIARYLAAERGASIDAVDGKGFTALKWAASKGHKDVVTVLVAVGKTAKAEAETLEVAMSEDARKIAEHHSAALDAEKGGRRPGKPPSAKIGLRSLAWDGSLFEKSVRSQLRANQQLGVREELDYSALSSGWTSMGTACTSRSLSRHARLFHHRQLLPHTSPYTSRRCRRRRRCRRCRSWQERLQ